MSTSIEVDAPSGTPAPAAGGDAAADATGLIEDATVLTLELRALLHDQFQLFTQETRLAAKSMMTMIAAAVWIGMLLATAWLGLVGALALTLMKLGVPTMLAVLSIALLSLVVAPFLYAIIRDRARSLGYPATLRTLKHPSQRRGDRKRV